MPLAFKNAGLWFGLPFLIVICAISTYCVHILIRCAHVLYRRVRVPALSYAEIAETAFLAGPPKWQRWSGHARFLINAFIVSNQIGACCVYNVIVAQNVKGVLEYYCSFDLGIRTYIMALLVPLIPLLLVRKLKLLTPFSMIANLCIFTGMAITVYYLLIDIPSVSERPAIAAVSTWPSFFGTVLFAVSSVGIVMSLENSMETPEKFIGCPSVLNIGMTIVTILYALIGFLGYLKYGEDTADNISMSLPQGEM